MNNKKVIGIDLDDILFDFYSHLCLFINSKINTNYKKSDMTDFMLDKVLKCPREDALKLIADFYQSDHHQDALPISGAKESISNLAKDYSLYIVSARPEHLRKRTEDWIQKHFGNVFEKIYLGNHYHGNGSKRTKLEICEEIGASIYIEDFIPNAIEVADSGKQVFLLDNPWNQSEIPRNIQRVYSWNEIVNCLI